MTERVDELQLDIERSRARLDVTLDRLEEKMSVSGIVDDVLGGARRGRYAPLFDRALDTLRHNPVPVLLVAAGAAMLLHRLGRKPVQPAARMARPLTDQDMPPEPRLYRSGATTLQSPDERVTAARVTNGRI